MKYGGLFDAALMFQQLQKRTADLKDVQRLVIF